MDNKEKEKLILAIDETKKQYPCSYVENNGIKSYKSADDKFIDGIRRGLNIAKTIIQH